MRIQNRNNHAGYLIFLGYNHGCVYNQSSHDRMVPSLPCFA